MKLRVRQIPGAYIGKHVEVVDSRRQRVWPPLAQSRTHNGITLGCNRDEAEGFIAGYSAGSSQNGSGQ